MVNLKAVFKQCEEEFLGFQIRTVIEEISGFQVQQIKKK